MDCQESVHVLSSVCHLQIVIYMRPTDGVPIGKGNPPDQELPYEFVSRYEIHTPGPDTPDDVPDTDNAPMLATKNKIRRLHRRIAVHVQ